MGGNISRKIAVYTIIVAIVLSFAIPAYSSKSSSKSKVVTVWLGSWWENEAPRLQKEFAKRHPGYSLKIELMPINNYLENAITAILGGNSPDALDLDLLMIPTIVGQNLVKPLNDFMKRYNITPDMFSSVYKGCVSNGITYAIPDRTGPGVLMYNKTMFDKAHVPYPYDNMPLNKFLDICRKLTIPGKQYGFGIAAAKSDPANVMTSFVPFLWANGGDFLTKDLKHSAMNTPGSIAGVKFWVELYTKYKVVPEGCINYAITKDLVPLFLNGQIAMVNMNETNILKVPEYEKKNNFKTGTCLLPGPYSRGGGWALTIPVSAKNVEGAEKFIAFFIKPEIIGEQKVVMPAIIKAQKQSKYWSSPTFDIFYKADQKTKLLPFHPKWTQIQNIVIEELQNALQKRETPEQAAKMMHKRINEAIGG